MRVVDLFCGCGGMSLGFTNAGFDIVASIDNWEKAVKIYQDNFNHPCILQDLSDEQSCLEIISNYSPDMIIGGPPCQDFSSAGKRDENGGRADLTYSFCNIVSSCNPKWFVMENVERIKKSHILKDVIDQFSDVGYGMTAMILDASYCNVPQARKRFFLVGCLGERNNALLDVYKRSLNNSPMSVRDYLGDSLGLEYYYRHPRNYSRRGVFSIDEPSATIRGVNRPVPSGYSKHSADPEEAELKTIRPLTTIERSYIQTFPKDFKLNDTKTSIEQMIGNAVPVNLGQFVANGVKEYENNKSSKEFPYDFFDSKLEVIIPNSFLKPLDSNPKDITRGWAQPLTSGESS